MMDTIQQMPAGCAAHTGRQQCDADPRILASTIYAETVEFCRRFLPSQGIEAILADTLARSIHYCVKYLSEGCAVLKSDLKTSQKKIDSARTYLGDFRRSLVAFLVQGAQTPWKDSDPCASEIFDSPLVGVQEGERGLCGFAGAIIAQRARLARFFMDADAVACARALIVLSTRLMRMMAKHRPA